MVRLLLAGVMTLVCLQAQRLGEAWPLAGLPDASVIAIVLPAGSCADAIPMTRALRVPSLQDHRVLVVATASSRPCAALGDVSMVSAPQLPSQRATLFLDDEHRVRYLRAAVSLEDQRSAIAELVDFDWGRATFEATCSHCHGHDGTETSYPGTKSLHRVTDRLTAAQIIERTNNVPLSTWKARDQERLLLYLRGL